MRKRERDDNVFGMLESERARCVRLSEALQNEIDKLPKGSIGIRRVKSGGREYEYQCLKFREGEKVVFKHVTANEIECLQVQVNRRVSLQKDLRAYKKRVRTLENLIAKGKK